MFNGTNETAVVYSLLEQARVESSKAVAEGIGRKLPVSIARYLFYVNAV